MPEVELIEHQHHPKTRPEVGREERGEDFGVMMMNLCQRRPAADGGIALGLGRGKAAQSEQGWPRFGGVDDGESLSEAGRWVHSFRVGRGMRLG